MQRGNISTLTLSIVASAVLVANRFVNQAGAYPAAGGLPIGVTRTAAAVGDLMAVDVEGTALVEASAAIPADSGIQVGADGKAAPLTTGTAVGRALNATSGAGELVEVLLIPAAKAAA